MDNRKQYLILFLLLLLPILLQSGCEVIYRKNLIPLTEPFSERPSVNKDFSLSFNLICNYMMVHGDKAPLYGYKCNEIYHEIEDVFIQSGYFKKIILSKTMSDFHMDLEIVSLGDLQPLELASAFICGFTLGIVPYVSTTGYELNCHITRKDGIKKSYKITDKAIAVRGGLAGLADKDNKNVTTIEELRVNMYRYLILQMEKDGLFSGKNWL